MLIKCCMVSLDSSDSQQEITALYERFCALDRNGKGYISADEFMAIPEFALNPLAQVKQSG